MVAYGSLVTRIRFDRVGISWMTLIAYTIWFWLPKVGSWTNFLFQ